MTDKPDLTKIWAENADPADIKNPDLDEAGKFQKGWLSEIPPHTWFNYIQNNFSAALAHFNEYGIAQWDSATVYPVGGWARSTVDNEVYVALVAQLGNEPSASPIQWNKVIVPVDLSPYAPLNSPTFTGTPTAPTPTAGDDSTKLATTEFVKAAGGATVISSGSNANGYYRIWSDGYIEQWGRMSMSSNSSATQTLPVSYSSPPTKLLSSSSEDTSGGDACNILNPTNTTVKLTNGSGITNLVNWATGGY